MTASTGRARRVAGKQAVNRGDDAHQNGEDEENDYDERVEVDVGRLAIWVDGKGDVGVAHVAENVERGRPRRF